MITAAMDVAAVAERAFVLGYPLVLTKRTMARAPVNQLVLCRDTPDTLQLSAWLDLAAEPLVLSVPDTSGRYYALWMRDAFNTVFSSIGARTTGTEPRAFGVLGPDSHAVRLGSGLTTVASPTRVVHLAGCVEAVAERDDAVLDWARERFSLSPLSHWRGLRPRRRAAAAPQRSDRSPVDEVERMDARAFFAELLRLAQDNPPDLDGRLLLDRLREIAAVPEYYPEVERGLRRGRAAVRAAARRGLGETSGHWTIANVSDADHVRRASAARADLGVGPAREALSARLDADADGEPLTGERRYLLRFAPAQAPPVHGFWSLTARADSSAFSIGDLRGLRLDLDGSLPIYVQHRPPARVRRSNWLPVPSEGFSIVLSLYWPAEPALQHTWEPPALERVA